MRMKCAPGNKDSQLVLGAYIAAFLLGAGEIKFGCVSFLLESPVLVSLEGSTTF